MAALGMANATLSGASSVSGSVVANGRMVSVTVIVAVSVNTNGRREILGMTVDHTEAELFYVEFLCSVARCSLRRVKLAISDLHQGRRGRHLQGVQRHFAMSSILSQEEKEISIIPIQPIFAAIAYSILITSTSYASAVPSNMTINAQPIANLSIVEKETIANGVYHLENVEMKLGLIGGEQYIANCYASINFVNEFYPMLECMASDADAYEVSTSAAKADHLTNLKYWLQSTFLTRLYVNLRRVGIVNHTQQLELVNAILDYVDKYRHGEVPPP